MNDIITDEVRRALTELEHMSDEDLAAEIRQRAAAYDQEIQTAKATLYNKYKAFWEAVNAGTNRRLLINYGQRQFNLRQLPEYEAMNSQNGLSVELIGSLPLTKITHL